MGFIVIASLTSIVSLLVAYWGFSSPRRYERNWLATGIMLIIFGVCTFCWVVAQGYIIWEAVSPTLIGDADDATQAVRIGWLTGWVIGLVGLHQIIRVAFNKEGTIWRA